MLTTSLFIAGDDVYVALQAAASAAANGAEKTKTMEAGAGRSLMFPRKHYITPQTQGLLPLLSG